MICILDIPDDIFLEILSCFENSKRDLLRIAKVSRRFGVLTRGHIFRNVRLLVINPSIVVQEPGTRKAGENPRTGNPEPDYQSYPLFLRSITENAALAPLVRTLSIRWVS